MIERKLIIHEPDKRNFRIYSDEPLNVCAYCRVSTDDCDQKNSLETQKKFFEMYFHKHPNWENIGIFADEGISGTSLEKRDSFNRMVSIAKRGDIDIILTKEVSRFSRNVQHLLNVVEELRSKGVYIWFLSDDINTESNDYREKLTQIATNAEQESLRTSRRVKWGQQQKMQDGIVFGRKEMLGYNIIRDELGNQKLVIIEDEALIVRKIFQWFADGDGTYRIARKLENEGIKTKRYKNGWSNTVILRILRNEKYVGDLQQGKTYTPDPLNHKKKLNKGQSHLFYIRDHHPESAIIDRDTWNKAQQILKEREPSEDIKALYSNRYWTSGKIYCGDCGGRYVSYRKKQKSQIYKAWVCFENHQRGKSRTIIDEETGESRTVGCNAVRVNDKVLKTAIYDIITSVLIPYKKEICDSILSEFKKSKKHNNNSRKIDSTNKKLASKEKELINLTRNFSSGLIPADAYQITVQAIKSEIDSLRSAIAALTAEKNSKDDETAIFKDYVAEIEKIVSLTDDDINDELFERITRKIVVYPDRILEFHLSFMPRPIYMQYTTSGRGDNYTAVFYILTKAEFEKLTKK